MITEAQKHLQSSEVDGWLLYDFHKNNPLAHRVLDIPGGMATRRFIYWIPAIGTPIKIVHAIEAQMLDHLPGEKRIYSSWQSLEKEIKNVLKGHKRIAMEYSPNNAIPYVSKVDAGTVDLIRSFGVEVVSSANFLLYFTACLSEKQMESQSRAARALDEIVRGAWIEIGHHLKQGITESDVQQWILGQFKKRGLSTDSGPIVAVNEHSADPHFVTGTTRIREGDFILIDLWAKEAGDSAIWGDITRVAVAGKPSARHQEIFAIVRKAQKIGIDLVKERFKEKRKVQGWEVDEAVRSSIQKAGYGQFFLHRTGHSIEVELHGSGTHMDNLEMHDERPIVPMSCFSVEPGIYLPGEFGVRLESDVLVYRDGRVEVTGGEQDSLVQIE